MNVQLSVKAATVAGCEACAVEIESILAGHELQARFQPVADLTRGEICGHVASVRSASGSFCGAANLTAGPCNQLGTLAPLTALSLKIAADSLPPGGAKMLFFQLPQGMLQEAGWSPAELLGHLPAEHEFPRSSLVVMLPVSSGFGREEFERAVQLAEFLRRHSVQIASSDFGCTRAEKMLWGWTQTDYVMLESHLLEAVDRHAANHERLVAKLRQHRDSGRQVVANGIKTLSELHLLKHLDIRLAAGDFFGRFSQHPTRTLSAAAHKALVMHGEAKARSEAVRRVGGVLEKLLTKSPTVTPRTTVEEVFVLFERDLALRAIAVVSSGIPTGLIARYEMVDNMSRPFRHELFGRKSCVKFMDPQPLILDINLPLAEISEMVVNADPRHLISGFIITDCDAYVGMGSVQDLVKEITVMQMDAAKYSNPLTQLPGNVPINQHIDKLLASGEACSICYCDLDHFKPFNDVYGYAKGDEVIQLTGRILSEICDAERDFIGHIGGDDFVLVMRSADIESRCQRALAQFGGEIVRFFSAADIERGGYVTENRKGQLEFQELIALSIGAFLAEPEIFKNHLQVSIIASEVKKKAKAIKGNSFYLNQRDYSGETIP